MKRIMFFVIAMLTGFLTLAEERIVKTSDGVDLHVTIKGQGLPLLYLHGGPGSGAYWMEYFAGDMLEERFQMIYLDQRGVSRSGSPANGDYSPERMVQDFEEVREALGIDRWLTFGHSFGGILQMVYYEQAPHSILGMMMFNCTLNFQDALHNLLARAMEITDAQDDEYFNNLEEPLLNRTMAAIAKSMEMGVWWKMHYDTQAEYDLMDEVMGHIKNWNGDFSNRAIFMEEYFRDFSPLTNQVSVPVLVFYGERDHAVGYEYYKNMSFPNQILHSYPGIHMPFMDGKDYFAKALDDYKAFYQQQHLTSK